MSKPNVDPLFDEFGDDSTDQTEFSPESLGDLTLDTEGDTGENDEQISEESLNELLQSGSDTGQILENEEGGDSDLTSVFGDDSEEDSQEDEEDESILTVYNEDCLKCTHLVGTMGTKAFKKCHHTQGNDYCPAATTKIVIGVPTDKIVAIILEAEAANDMSRLAGVYSRLASKDPAVQSLVKSALEKARG